MELLIIIIGYSTLSWVAYNFFEIIINFIMDKLSLNFLSRLLCPKCFSFWFSLIVSGGNIFIASISAFINFLIDKYINTKNTIL